MYPQLHLHTFSILFLSTYKSNHLHIKLYVYNQTHSLFSPPQGGLGLKIINVLINISSLCLNSSPSLSLSLYSSLSLSLSLSPSLSLLLPFSQSHFSTYCSLPLSLSTPPPIFLSVNILFASAFLPHLYLYPPPPPNPIFFCVTISAPLSLESTHHSYCVSMSRFSFLI